MRKKASEQSCNIFLNGTGPNHSQIENSVFTGKFRSMHKQRGKTPYLNQRGIFEMSLKRFQDESFAEVKKLSKARHKKESEKKFEYAVVPNFCQICGVRIPIIPAQTMFSMCATCRCLDEDERVEMKRSALSSQKRRISHAVRGGAPGLGRRK